MLKQRKIKVIKRQTVANQFSEPENQIADQRAFLPKKIEREVTKRVNDWVFDWRNQKRAREINAAAFISG